MQKEELKNATEKMSFLIRYGPMLRKMDPEELQEKEVLWQKELVTRGCPIISQNQPNNCIYIVLKGKVNILFDTYSLGPGWLHSADQLMGDGQRWLKIQRINKGFIFGEHSALNQVSSDCTFEAASSEVLLYKI